MNSITLKWVFINCLPIVVWRLHLCNCWALSIANKKVRSAAFLLLFRTRLSSIIQKVIEITNKQRYHTYIAILHSLACCYQLEKTKQIGMLGRMDGKKINKKQQRQQQQ